jgi:uncharacterized membrane protein
MSLAIVINLILSVVVLTAILSLAAWGIRGSRVERRARAIRIARGRAHARVRPARGAARGASPYGDFA